MPEWDGRGLPPVARARVGRFAESGLKTSLLSVPGAVGAEVAGFTAVGEVMGCVVQQTAWTSLGQWAGDQVRQSADLLRNGYATALDRLAQEATALGADGVLGIEFTTTSLDGVMQEVVALGTAVRAETTQRPRRLFTTDLPGQDVGKLMQAGWVPVRVAVGVAARAAYDYSMQYQTSTWAGNVEVDAPTKVVNEVRAAARTEFARAIRDSGADGGIVSDLRLRTWPVQERAVVGIASVTGTAIAQFHAGRAAPTSALKILPLNRS
ncbi:heavy metal-binding domain-containing protein [Amycolatopsis sp. SID8362]|uniref:heavy metal-binding domain-containing protein n=1 Tax=Amycolatopsis sp. SID8362 TaxID=2690346 RepID=UPI00136FD942|nr:heavy metal-binding domain-containing protein [Amycolatopsis sp. SID8362]NBH06521.1 heavy metal-binding domain-containing protein [Amycolatopsis sp. SID8362]NED43218.1 heavy metal-binding domain-containing protein [Amycolatopsis sp. SID8362]